MSLLAVAIGLERVLNNTKLLTTEEISLHDALGRITADDMKSNVTQPPFAASAMDGYAVRYADIKEPLKLVGESQAGCSYDGVLKQGQTVRIFTGAPMVDGADTVVIQENVSRNDEMITIHESKEKGGNIHAIGGDFMQGDILVAKNIKLDARHIGLLAAGNIATIKVYKKPRVALLSTGDELLEVGSQMSADKIINSNIPLFKGLITEHGGIPIDLGTAKDTVEDVKAKIALVKDVDIFVSIGGVSVGDYDIIQDVLKDAGLKVAFWKVAMQPGKPIVYGDFNGISFFGMPGNPSSAYVCFANFMLPAMQKMQGCEPTGFKSSYAKLSHDIKAGNTRDNYMRARYIEDQQGIKHVDARASQGSSKLKTLADANCLLLRENNSPAAKTGDLVKIYIIE